MRILHVGEYVNGGVATYIKNLIDESKKDNIEIYLLMSSLKSIKKWELDESRIGFYLYKRSIFKIIPAMANIHIYIKKINPDIVHVHSSWAGVLVRIPYLLGKRKEKIVYTPHGWSFLMETPKYKRKIYNIIERILSSVTDQIINISRHEEMEAIKCGIPSSKMVVIYNGVKDRDEKKYSAIRMDEKKINLLFVGRLDRQKGVDILLKYYYQKEFSNLHLYIIGEGILDRKEITNDEKTTYVGWVDNNNIDSYYNACDVVIMPSRWEGFGLVAIEAMRNKKPIIASNRGALPEIISNGINGYIFDLDNSEYLEEILKKLDKITLRKMGLNGYERYLKYFRVQEFYEKTNEVYKSMMKK